MLNILVKLCWKCLRFQPPFLLYPVPCIVAPRKEGTWSRNPFRKTLSAIFAAQTLRIVCDIIIRGARISQQIASSKYYVFTPQMRCFHSFTIRKNMYVYFFTRMARTVFIFMRYTPRHRGRLNIDGWNVCFPFSRPRNGSLFCPQVRRIVSFSSYF